MGVWTSVWMGVGVRKLPLDGICSRYSATQTTINTLLKMNEWINDCNVKVENMKMLIDKMETNKLALGKRKKNPCWIMIYIILLINDNKKEMCLYHSRYHQHTLPAFCSLKLSHDNNHYQTLERLSSAQAAGTKKTVLPDSGLMRFPAFCASHHKFLSQAFPPWPLSLPLTAFGRLARGRNESSGKSVFMALCMNKSLHTLSNVSASPKVTAYWTGLALIKKKKKS